MSEVTTLSVTDSEVAARARRFRDERGLTTTEMLEELLAQRAE
jgi:hypothetical protein